MSATDRVRIGTLGAARIAPGALIKPARKVADAEVVAVAARDPARAEKFARKHKIPKVHATYDDVIGDPDVDAIYNPLPNGLHAEWTLKAITAGKHVLCEKPFTSNAAEAEQVAAAADGSGLVVILNAANTHLIPIQTGRQLASVIADRVRIQVTKDGQTKGGMVPAKHLSIMLGSEAFLRHFRPLDEVARTSQYLADFIPTTPGYNDRGPASLLCCRRVGFVAARRRFL